MPEYQLDAFPRFTAAPSALWKGWCGVITLPPDVDVKPLGVRAISREVHVFRFSFNREAMVAYRDRGLGQEMPLIERSRIEWLRTFIEAQPEQRVYVSDRSKAELDKVRGFLERTTRLDDGIRFGPLTSVGQEWDVVMLLSSPSNRDQERFRGLILTHEPDDRRVYLLLKPDDSYGECRPGDWGLDADLGWSNHRRVITKEDVESWA